MEVEHEPNRNLIVHGNMSFTHNRGCSQPETTCPRDGRLLLVAESHWQWTGVAVSAEGCIFDNYPRWSDDVTFSVGELSENGTILPRPDDEWNNWDATMAPENHFICVQSVYADGRENLWIPGPADPRFEGVAGGGPGLVKVDLGTDTVTYVLASASTSPFRKVI